MSLRPGAALLLASSTAVAQSPANEKPDALRQVDIVQKLYAQVPLDAVFRDENGVAVPLGSLVRDKPVVLALVYYECPMLCTLVLNGLLRTLRAVDFDVGDQFDVVTVSFDPRDQPKVAAAKRTKYLREYGRGDVGGWHFLTGEENTIRRLTDAVGFRYAFDEESGTYAHASAIMVLTPSGRVSHYFYGVEYSPRDLKLALVSAADENIGSPVDRVLLYCYAYDPTTGEYGLAIMNVIRVAGTATVVALAAFVILMWRRDRRPRTEAST